MPSHSRQPTPTSTTTAPETGTTPQGGDNTFLAALLAGTERVDYDASYYLSQGIQFQQGMKGDVIKRLQEAIGAGADGSFGAGTFKAVQAFQTKNGLPATGTVDEATWGLVVATPGSLATLTGEADFARMWGAHPHNYLADQSQNTSSEELRTQLGMRESDAPNTCALRLSTMLNRLGGNNAIDTTKGKEAGLDKMRAGGLYMPKVQDPETASQNDRVIVSAREMWTYLEKHRGAPDAVWPPQGRYKTQEQAEAGAREVEAAVDGKKGFVAFDKIYGYGGSGHVDIFDGKTLSDGSWYPAERIMLWYVVQGPDGQPELAGG